MLRVFPAGGPKRHRVPTMIPWSILSILGQITIQKHLHLVFTSKGTVSHFVKPLSEFVTGLGAPVSSRKVLTLQGPEVSCGVDTLRKVLLLGEAVDHAFPVNFLVQILCVRATTSKRAKMSLVSQKDP